MQAMASNFSAMCYPMAITAAGIVVCFITSLFATSCSGVTEAKHVEWALKKQLVISTVLMTPVVTILSYTMLPTSFWVAAQIGHAASDPKSSSANRAVCESVVWDTTKESAYKF